MALTEFKHVMTPPAPIRILFLGACPAGHTPLRLDREFKAIKRRLRRSRFRGHLELISELATEAGELAEQLVEHNPHVVHISGHGTTDQKLVLEDVRGHAAPVPFEAIAELLATVGPDLRCVVISACHGLDVARSVVKHVDCVVGASHAIRDKVATSFAVAFYGTLAAGKDMQSAFNVAQAHLGVEALPNKGLEMLAREGVDLSTVKLIDSEPAPETPWWVPWLGLGCVAALAVTIALAVGLWSGRDALPAPDAADDRLAIANTAPLPDPGGLVLLGPDSGSHAEIHRSVCESLQTRGEQLVRCATIARAALSSPQAEELAWNANATILAVVDTGPALRIVARPGAPGQDFLRAIQPISIRQPDTRAALAPVLHALAWSTSRAPAGYSAEIPGLDPLTAGPKLTVLAEYLRYLTGQTEPPHTDARSRFFQIFNLCLASGEFPAEWHCGVAGYMYFGVLAPEVKDAARRLAELAENGPPGVAWAAALESVNRDCETAPDRAVATLHHWDEQLAAEDCARMFLVPAASCLVIRQRRSAPLLDALASLDLAGADACGSQELLARIQAQRAKNHELAGDWRKAADEFAAAGERSPPYLLDWAEAELQRGPVNASDAATILRRLDSADVGTSRLVRRAYMAWLVAPAGPERQTRVRALCDAYERAADRTTLMPDIASVKRLVCDSRRPDLPRQACRVYHALRSPKDAGLSRELAPGLCDP